MDIRALSVRGNHDQEVIRRSLTYARAGDKLKFNEHTRLAKALTDSQWEWLTALP